MSDRPIFLRARWIHLAMLNYEVDPGLLEPLVPRGTALDFFEGRCYLSVVGFQFLDTRVLGLPIPGHRNFDEINLRFYVRREQDGELRRGVVFVKEIVPRPAIAWIARWIYNENYVCRPMRHQDEIGRKEQPRVSYAWRDVGRWNELSLRVSGRPELKAEDSEESFISEHYWGYVRQRDGSTMEYRVEHPRWQVWRAEECAFDCDLGSIYGLQYASALAGSPRNAFLADGSSVLVRRGRLLEDTRSR